MSTELKPADVIGDWKRKRIVPLPECQLGWACLEIVPVPDEELKTESGNLYLPTGKEHVLEPTATEERKKGVMRFYVRATHKQWQCSATEVRDTPFGVGDEVLPEQPHRVRERSEAYPCVLPENHMMIRIENICAWQPVKMDVSRQGKS